jgi:hypothetical protein
MKAVKPKKIPICKICKQPFVKYNTIQNKCVDCAIKLQKEATEQNLLVKGTPAFKKAKEAIKSEDRLTDLQDNINLLARLIDAKFGYTTCIDCNKNMDKRVAGAHFHDVGSNRHIRFNLNNIHTSSYQCNNYSSRHKVGYKSGLEQRYGKEYLDFVEELQTKYRDVKLAPFEISEKLALVRKIIRTFHTYNFENSLAARKQLNLLIGIYV